METHDWVSSGIAALALVVAIWSLVWQARTRTRAPKSRLKLHIKPNMNPFLRYEQITVGDQPRYHMTEDAPPLWTVEVVVINESPQVVRIVEGTVFVSSPESGESSGGLREGAVDERLTWPGHRPGPAASPEHPVVLQTQREVKLSAVAGSGHLEEGGPEDTFVVRAEVRTDDGRVSSERTVVRRGDVIRRSGHAVLI
jgi:hypothetical protein